MSYHASETGVKNRTCGTYPRLTQMGSQQPLHTLYTGRFLTPRDHYSGDTTPHENEEGLAAHRNIHKALYKAAMLEEEALNRHLGGKYPKVLPHPPIEPDSFSEDPALRNIRPSSAVEDNTVSGSDHLGTGSAILEELYSPNEEKKKKKGSCGNCGDAKEYHIPSKKGFLSTAMGTGCCGGLAVILIIILIVLYCMY